MNTTFVRAPRGTTWRAVLAAFVVGSTLFAPAARAGLFDDDEARRAILDIRTRIDQNAERQKAGQQQLSDQIDQLKRSLLDLNNQLEQVRADNAKLRGQNEELARDLSDVQRKQKDIQSGVDDRLRQFEPKTVTVDGKEFKADAEEKRQYDDAMDLLRKSDFAGTANALTAFRKRYPASGYNESALFWLGNAQYGIRQYREAIGSFRSLIATAPDSAKAPEALLAIANCQAELKDTKGARATIAELVKTYPKSEAAQAGRDRLASLK
ncbi:MAG: tol-pal system protein YbgF [Pseudomonadota bacterium]|nr:tol-pal system protein YbgF [Pseudomonadota bacterium]